MDTRRLTTLGMVVNEFIVNALRHAFPGGRPGSIRIALRQVDDRMARLTIADDGVGLAEGRAYSGTHGIGGRMVRSEDSRVGQEVFHVGSISEGAVSRKKTR